MTNEPSCNETGCEAPSEMIGDDGFCPAHGEDGSTTMAERGRKGGAAGSLTLEPGSLLPIESADDVRDAAALIADAQASGELGEKRGRAVTKSLRLVLQAIEVHGAEQQVAQVRDKIQELAEDRGRPRKPWEG